MAMQLHALANRARIPTPCSPHIAHLQCSCTHFTKGVYDTPLLLCPSGPAAVRSHGPEPSKRGKEGGPDRWKQTSGHRWGPPV